MCLFLCWLTIGIKMHLIVEIDFHSTYCLMIKGEKNWLCLNMLEHIKDYMLELLFFLLYLFVDVKKGERQMNLSMGRSFFVWYECIYWGEHIILIDIICICISLGGVFLIHLIGVLSSSKRERLISPCLILMIPKHLYCYF